MKNLGMGLLAGLTLLVGSCEKKAGSGGESAAKATAAKSGSHVLARKDELGAVGKTRVANLEKVIRNAVLEFEGGGQKMRGSFSRREFKTEVTEVLGKTKARVTLASTESEGMMMLGNGNQPTPEGLDPLKELPVTVELKDGKWSAALETGEATPAQQQALGKIAGKISRDGYSLYGDVPRKAGDTWEANVGLLNEFVGLDSLMGRIRVEFVEVRDFEGIPCAVLEMEIDISGYSPPEGSANSMGTKIKGKATVHRSLEDLVDLDMELKGEATIEGRPAPGMSMRVKGPVTVTSKVTVQP